MKLDVRRLSTGNEMVSIPEISTRRCSIETIGFLHRGLRAVVEISGGDDLPFLQPFVTVEDSQPDWGESSWSLDQNWIPTFEVTHGDCVIRGRVYAPLQRRGFVFALEIESKADREIAARAGWNAHWEKTCHAAYTAKPMSGVRRVGVNQWLGVPYMEFQSVAPHFAVAFRPSEVMEVEVFTGTDAGRRVVSAQEEVAADSGVVTGISLAKEIRLAPGEHVALAVCVAVGLEEISAVSSAADMSRRPPGELLQSTIDWLRDHSLRVPDEELESTMNLNLFYNYFYAQGVTLDTEEHVVVTSRSTRYPLTTAYSDRDALLWSLPAVLRIDPRQARRMLNYAFRVQIRNVGIHSRFIDGIALEPGFELDELCAPALALWRYVKATNDISIALDREVQAGLNHILGILALKRHSEVALFETSLLPSDDVAMHPYVTYDNALVWRMLVDLASIYERIGDVDRKDDTLNQAKRVKRAIMEHAVVDGPFGEMFAWSFDLEGNYRVLDYPQGSLQLLPYIGFCDPDLRQYKNTLRWIRSEENPMFTVSSRHGRRPSMFSLANELLLSPSEEILDFLRRAPMDNGLFCEIADAETGEAVSGRGYAACAGYMAYAMAVALNAEGPDIRAADKSATPHFRLESGRYG